MVPVCWSIMRWNCDIQRRKRERERRWGVKLHDKLWKRIVIVLTAPIWITPLLVLSLAFVTFVALIYGSYAYLKDGKWEEI
jgi:hypothetical protein